MLSKDQPSMLHWGQYRYTNSLALNSVNSSPVTNDMVLREPTNFHSNINGNKHFPAKIHLIPLI